jgi:hypothetical protein
LIVLRMASASHPKYFLPFLAVNWGVKLATYFGATFGLTRFFRSR